MGWMLRQQSTRYASTVLAVEKHYHLFIRFPEAHSLFKFLALVFPSYTLRQKWKWTEKKKSQKTAIKKIKTLRCSWGKSIKARHAIHKSALFLLFSQLYMLILRFMSLNTPSAKKPFPSTWHSRPPFRLFTNTQESLLFPVPLRLR